MLKNLPLRVIEVKTYANDLRAAISKVPEFEELIRKLCKSVDQITGYTDGSGGLKDEISGLRAREASVLGRESAAEYRERELAQRENVLIGKEEYIQRLVNEANQAKKAAQSLLTETEKQLIAREKHTDFALRLIETEREKLQAEWKRLDDERGSVSKEKSDVHTLKSEIESLFDRQHQLEQSAERAHSDAVLIRSRAQTELDSALKLKSDYEYRISRIHKERQRLFDEYNGLAAMIREAQSKGVDVPSPTLEV